nr:uncharacterized protein LOC4324208 isoform X3 [Oryza sativa Japonica Group]
MATTAAAYGCPAAAAAAPFAASVSRRRAPLSCVSLASSSSRRRTAEFPGLRVSCLRRILAVSACSGEADSDAGSAPAMEFLLGGPRNHRGFSRMERYRALGDSLQVDTVACHFSVLRDMFPNDDLVAMTW